MLKRSALTCLAALALSGPALAACNGEWAQPSAETLSMGDGTEFRISRFANRELKLVLVEAGRPVEFVAALGVGFLAKGIPEAELREAHWLTLFGASALSVVWDAVRVAPCSASGTYEIAQDVPASGANRVPGVKLKRALGQAVADGQGLIRYSIRFVTEPALPPERAPTYAGTLSFQAQGEALPGDTDVGGFRVLSRDRPDFVAAPGTTLAQLRAQLAQPR